MPIGQPIPPPDLMDTLWRWADEARRKERDRCIKSIQRWPGLSDDEKRIAVMAIETEQ